MDLRKIVFYTKTYGPGSFPFSEKHIAMIREVAPDAKLVFTDWNDDLLLQEAEGCDAAVAQNNHPLPSAFYEKATDLKWVHCMMSGVDQMRVPGSEHVVLTSTMGTHGIPISEHVLAMMLSASRKLYISRDHQYNREWVRPNGITELRGAIGGVVGFGHVGTEVAALLSAIGMNVVALNDVPPAPEHMPLLKEYYPLERMNEFLSVCDYIILSLPLTEKTRHMFGAEQFHQMKRSAWIINVARGPIINEAELLGALTSGEIAGACLDVAEEEPRPETDPLWEQPNVIITPHVANMTPKKMDRIAVLLKENIRRFLQDEPLLYQK